jgi:hypothetical protein
MSALITSYRYVRRFHPWVVPGVLLSGSAALGTALPELLTLAHRVLS